MDEKDSSSESTEESTKESENDEGAANVQPAVKVDQKGCSYKAFVGDARCERCVEDGERECWQRSAEGASCLRCGEFGLRQKCSKAGRPSATRRRKGKTAKGVEEEAKSGGAMEDVLETLADISEAVHRQADGLDALVTRMEGMDLRLVRVEKMVRDLLDRAEEEDVEREN